MADNDIILKIKVDKDKALQSVKEYTATVEALKEKQKVLRTEIMNVEGKQEALNERLKNGQVSAEAAALESEYYAKQLDALRSEQILTIAETNNQVAALRGYQKELQNVLKQEEAANNEKIGSMTSLRAELSNLIKEYDNLGRKEREGAKGTELLNKITKLTDEIKNAEEATQRYQRNVGNYKSALEGAEKAVGGLKDGVLGFVTGGNPMLEMLVNTSSQLGSVKKAFSVAGQGAVMLGKQLWALVATPIGAFLTAVAVVVTLFNKGLQSSEERTNRFKVVLAPLQGALDGLANILGTVCDWLLTFVEWQSKAWEAALEFTASLIGQESAFAKGVKARQEYIAIEKESQELEKKIRDEKELTALREKDVSDLRAKFAEKDKYTNKERLAFLDQAIAKEKEQAQENKNIAQKKLELLEREAALSDNDAEMNNKLAEAKAEVHRADKALSDKMCELNAQRVEAINAINAEAEAEKKKAQEKAKAAAEAANERAKKEKDALREAEDAITAIITDNIAKRKAEIKKDYDRQIEDIKTRLATEKNLTVVAREALNKTIGALYIKQQQELNAVDAEVEAQRKAKEAEDAEAAKQARATAQQKLIEERATQLQTELELIRSANMSELEEQRAMLDAKIAAKQEEIATMQQLEGESDAEFYLRKLEVYNALTDLEEQHKDTNVRIAEEEAKKKREAYNSVMQAMSAMGEHSKALGKLSKVMGLAQIAVDTGKAISAGVAEAIKAGPFPANLAAIATTIATVMANMATAISSIKSAKFATGGLVEGAGSGTSDSIQARLSNGESVITAQATSAFAPLLSAINVMGGGVPISVAQSSAQQMGEDMLARAVARGVANIRPIVSVEEINRVSSNVEVIENLATL